MIQMHNLELAKKQVTNNQMLQDIHGDIARLESKLDAIIQKRELS